jgi:hypothetical protein
MRHHQVGLPREGDRRMQSPNGKDCAGGSGKRCDDTSGQCRYDVVLKHQKVRVSSARCGVQIGADVKLTAQNERNPSEKTPWASTSRFQVSIAD